MTPSERALLQHVGVITLNNLARFTVYTLLYGIFIPLIWISTRSYIQRGLNSRPKWTMLGVTLICFFLAGLFWSAYAAGFVIQVRSILTDGTLPDGAKLKTIEEEIFPLGEIQYWSSLLAPLISDSVVVWRAWVIFGEQKWIMVGPLALLLGTAGTSVTYAVFTSRYSNMVADQLGHNQTSITLYNSFLALSLATNAIATFLILYKLWTLRTFMGEFSSERPTSVQRILIVILESGVAFCFLQAISLVLNFLSFPVDSPSYIAETSIVAIYTFITPMYPTLVTVMVNQQHTIVETFGFTLVTQQNKAGFDTESVNPHVATGDSTLGTVRMDDHASSGLSPVYMALTHSTRSDDTGTYLETEEEDVEE